MWEPHVCRPQSSTPSPWVRVLSSWRYGACHPYISPPFNAIPCQIKATTPTKCFHWLCSAACTCHEYFACIELTQLWFRIGLMFWINLRHCYGVCTDDYSQYLKVWVKRVWATFTLFQLIFSWPLNYSSGTPGE